LQKEFMGIRGFSVQNLWNMRQFYLEYYQNEKLQPLVGEISWTKNVVIFQKTKDILAREFYIKSVIKFGWTKDLLINHLDSKSYEKFLLNQTTKRLPSNLEKYLPTTDEIEKNLIKFMEGINEG
jgi:predicted nuclease of restriction endonuclease-like (RecB) superfamily